jgi:predicted RNase H-like HicB family nuclease
MDQKYRVDIGWSEEDQAFIARVPELDGVVTHGASVAEAAQHAEEAIDLHLESLQAHNEPIPDPVALKKLGGKYALRMGRDRHEKLVIESAKRNLSVNELLVDFIDRYFGGRIDLSTRQSASRARGHRSTTVKSRRPIRPKGRGKAG